MLLIIVFCFWINRLLKCLRAQKKNHPTARYRATPLLLETTKVPLDAADTSTLASTLKETDLYEMMSSEIQLKTCKFLFYEAVLGRGFRFLKW